jgi:hypothetical protein
MTKHERFRLVSYGICLILNIIGILKFCRYFSLEKNLAFAYPIIGTIFLFLVVHYLCIVGKAIKQDFALLIGLCFASMFLSMSYWTDKIIIIGSVSIIVIVILIFEYQPDWFRTVKKYLIKIKKMRLG